MIVSLHLILFHSMTNSPRSPPPLLLAALAMQALHVCICDISWSAEFIRKLHWNTSKWLPFCSLSLRSLALVDSAAPSELSLLALRYLWRECCKTDVCKQPPLIMHWFRGIGDSCARVYWVYRFYEIFMTDASKCPPDSWLSHELIHISVPSSKCHSIQREDPLAHSSHSIRQP